MKSQHEVRIEQSRLLNRMNDPMMQLQAMAHWGISPEQKEWIMRYAEIAEKQERNFKRGAVGTFENAEYLDKSGYYAKADAAIKAEQRRPMQGYMKSSAWPQTAVMTLFPAQRNIPAIMPKIFLP